MINETELKEEQEYLLKVLKLLESQISKDSGKIEEYSKDVKDQLKYTWDDDSQSDLNVWVENVRLVELRSLNAINTTDKIRAYLKMLKNAYFARVDFLTEGETIKIYLGIATLNDGSTFYVYDWRAPISSLFYDYEKGEAQYETPNGTIVKGKIVLKRQYKIEGDKIVQIFDTDMQVIDDILKRMLEGKTTDKMRNIVRTIQKEQNKIIRKKDVDILIVDGPAGSGKTSVAMHKAAYLLYAERKNITNSNILIISPNDIFSNYISNVLPEIGEDNVYQTTFMDFVKSQLDFKIKGTFSDLYETVYSDDPNNNVNSLEYNSIMLKYGATYIKLIEDYIAQNRNTILGIEDIIVDNNVVVEKEYLEKLANELEDNGMSLVQQARKLIDKITLYLAIKIGKTNSAAMLRVKKKIEENLNKINVKNLMLDLYSDCDRYVSMIENIYNTTGVNKNSRLTKTEIKAIFNYTKDLLLTNTIPFEDVVGYLYLKDRIQGSTVQSKIRYVLIDEAQDYTIMQYKILAHLFRKANITILGDINQSIMPFATHQNYESILNLLKQDRVGVRYDMTYLTKTYRSTYEINMFCKGILGDTNMYNQVDRHGDEVQVIKDKDFENTLVFKDALEIKKHYNSVAIITKTQAEADRLKEALDNSSYKSNAFKVVSGKDKVFVSDKILIIPSYLAKGLEFDAVLIFNASENNYPLQHKNLFYVACTRALHKLNVYYFDKPTALIKNAK